MEEGTWDVVETELFQQGAAKYLSDRELSAMRRELVADPLSGTPQLSLPGFFVLEWGKMKPLAVLYLVAPERSTIVLVEIQEGAETLVVEESEAAAIQDVYEVIKRAAGWVAGRALWEVIKRWWGF